MKKQGLFITFEGVDGSGKTTIINNVKQELEKRIENNKLNYLGVISTREPGGYENNFCESVRNLILQNEMSIKTEILLFAANRVEHLNQLIKPSLKENKIVLSDRFLDSSLVYQGIAKLNNWKIPYKINKWAFDTMPDITFLLDIDPEIAYKRMESDKNRTWDRFDNEKREFKNKIRQGFLKMSKKFSKRFVVINANNTIENIVNEIVNKICQFK